MVIQTAQKMAAPATKKRKPTVGIDQFAKANDVPVEEPKRRGRAPSGQVIVTFRMDPDVRNKLQAEGPGWGARANGILRKALGL